MRTLFTVFTFFFFSLVFGLFMLTLSNIFDSQFISVFILLVWFVTQGLVIVQFIDSSLSSKTAEQKKIFNSHDQKIIGTSLALGIVTGVLYFSQLYH